MKTNIIQSAFVILLMLAAFAGKLNSQNMILAGQTEGEYIHYTDYEPDSIVELFNYYDYFDLDVDYDGVVDLGFYVRGDYYPDWYYVFWDDIEIYNNNIEILLSTSNYAKNLSFGDTITDSLNWSGSNISPVLRRYYYSYYPPPGSGSYHGEFGSGYLGFRIINSWETYYGWIGLEAHVSPSAYCYIKAKSAAFYSQTVRIENIQKTSNKLTIFPNPCEDKFNIQIPEMNEVICRFHISDINGRKIKDGIITDQTTVIDVSDLYPGVYFVEVRNEANTIQRDKLIIL